MGSGPTSTVAPKRITDGLTHAVNVRITKEPPNNLTTGVVSNPKWECSIKIDEQEDEMRVSNGNNVIFDY